MAAIDCFRQLQDWPGSADTQWLRWQATYNEAIVWRQMGAVQRSVLTLTELVGEKAPDTEGLDSSPRHVPCSQSQLPESICLCARVARLSGLAQYTLDDWSTFPANRADLIVSDGRQLISELDKLRDTQNSPHDKRVAHYLYSESVRALGHVQLMSARTGPAQHLYKDGRIVGGPLNDRGKTLLQDAIRNLAGCDKTASSCTVYCDLAEAYALLGDYARAQGYARHATLAGSEEEQIERAFFLAAEIAILHNTLEAKDLATKYAAQFAGPVHLDEFKSLRAQLGITQHESSAPSSVPAASRSSLRP
jgi:hypothetical protein